jgi:hypothetical protein
MELAAIPRREPSGRPQRDAQDRDASVVTLTMRCIQLGLEPTKANIRDMRAPWWGCNAGRAMANMTSDHDQRVELWGAICHMRRTAAAYDAALGAPRRHPKCLGLLLPPEELSADASSPAPDTRTDEERQRHALNAWSDMTFWLSCAGPAAAAETSAAVLDDAPVKSGPRLIAALRCVADGLAGRPLTSTEEKL